MVIEIPRKSVTRLSSFLGLSLLCLYLQTLACEGESVPDEIDKQTQAADRKPSPACDQDSHNRTSYRRSRETDASP